MGLQQLQGGAWLNPPPEWSFEGDHLALTTGDKTDFWQETHYGFHHENGHFWHVTVHGDFTATLRFEGEYESLYDQAGLMLRVDAKHWIKLGIEHADGMTNFSVVVTRGRSDWSVIAQPQISGPQAVRLTRIGKAIIAHYKTPSGAWQLMRLADFTDAEAAQIGPMACSPERAGFRASFDDFQLGPPMAEPLHG